MEERSIDRLAPAHDGSSGSPETRGRDRIPARLAMASLALWSAFAWPCRAADDFQVTARARPDQELTLAFPRPVEIQSGVKYYLRLTRLRTRSPVVADAPLQPEQLGRSLAHVSLPKLRRGEYGAELVTGTGTVLGTGSNTLKVLASEPPRITKIIPATSYPENGRHAADGETYAFEVAGENLGEPGDLVVEINDAPLTFASRVDARFDRASEEECERYPCLVAGWRSLRILGVPRELPGVIWPLRIQLQLDGLTSNEEPLRLSWVSRRTPVTIALVVLGALVALVCLLSRRSGEDGRSCPAVRALFIDVQTNTYSLSHLQLMLWSSAAVFTYVYLAASQSLVQGVWVMPKVPQGLPALLGVSAGTSLLATGATHARGCKGAGPMRPGLADLISSGGVFAPERLQFLLWTLLGVAAYLSTTLLQDPATVTELPKIPDEYLPLMGVSSLGYLGGKLVRKAGPVIRQVLWEEKPGDLRIAGANLSRYAQVNLGGEALPAGRVVPGPQQGTNPEFVHELIVSGIVRPVRAAITIRVTNPDGQSAEFEPDSAAPAVRAHGEEAASPAPASAAEATS